MENVGRGQQAEPLVYIVVLNYNGIDFNDACIDSLLKTDYFNYKILFVDNGSTDGSIDRVRQRYPAVEVLENKANLFFAAGNNRGIEFALERGADYIFILNNDTEVDSYCLPSLVSFMEAMPESGAVQPLLCLMSHPQLIASAGCRISLSGRSWDDSFGIPCGSFGDDPRQVAGVTGGAMLVRADVLRKVGMFDEQYRMYFEDVDLSFRIQKAGLKLYVVPQGRVLHAVSATTKTSFSRMRIQLCDTNSYRIILTHFPVILALVGYPLSLGFSLGSFLYALIRGRVGHAGAAFMGALHGLYLFIPAICRRVCSKSAQRSVVRDLIDWKTLFPPKNNLVSTK